jgi:signal transduction histidine kinase
VLALNDGATGPLEKDDVRVRLEAERNALLRSGKLHWVHWAVVITSLLVTLIAWSFSNTQVVRNGNAQFDHAAGQILDLVTERMQKYEDGLWSGVAAIQSRSGKMSREEWKLYAQTLHLEEKYPGVNGIGVIHHVQPDQMELYLQEQRKTKPDFKVFPKHDRDDHFPITYIEPESVNGPAIGLDIAHEANRYSAAIKAGETGLAQITGPIRLLQYSANTPGFLFYAPFYESDLGGFAVNQSNNFVGMVYAPFVFNKLIDGTLGKSSRQLFFTIRDGDQVLYSENTANMPAPEMGARFTTTTRLNLYGRTWVFDIWAGPDFKQNVSSSDPLFILFGGITIDVMLFVLFLLLSRANLRTIEFADMVTAELQLRANELSTSNADLEKFAYIASHDLKTPLRGMVDLTEYIEEDLENYLEGDNANPQVSYNLGRMRRQILRMDNLIKGILIYSGIGRGDETIEHIDVNEAVKGIREELSLSDRQVAMANTLPHLHTNATRFNQVIANLIGNAAKYHNDLPNAEIIVSSNIEGNWVDFTVADNGPGIDARFHEKIFEPFQTLQPKDTIESTGIGLSIVKRTVEFYGGTLSIDSELKRGTSITFTWPRHVDPTNLEGST